MYKARLTYKNVSLSNECVKNILQNNKTPLLLALRLSLQIQRCVIKDEI